MNYSLYKIYIMKAKKKQKETKCRGKEHTAERMQNYLTKNRKDVCWKGGKIQLNVTEVIQIETV